MRNKAKKLDLAAASKDLSDVLIHAKLCDEDGMIEDSDRAPASPTALAAIAAACGLPSDEAASVASGSGATASP
ncbi:hypothetical protein D1007_56881 [Hordeum vulgare]|nr:hypothetical protein D1007_56881 [Hordeum vulgare]